MDGDLLVEELFMERAGGDERSNILSPNYTASERWWDERSEQIDEAFLTEFSQALGENRLGSLLDKHLQVKHAVKSTQPQADTFREDHINGDSIISGARIISISGAPLWRGIKNALFRGKC